MKICILVFFIFSLKNYASSQFFVTEILNNNVTLTVNPPYIVEGVESQVDIVCTFKRDNVPSMASVLSLVIGHSNKTDQPEFNYLALVNEMDGHAHNISHDVEVISGSIDNNGESKLHMRFMYPETPLIGLYMCEVTGFDQIGKPVNIYSTLNLLTTNIKDMVDLVNSKQECIDNQTVYIETMHKLHSTICTNYHPPFFYNGHVYYLSNAVIYFEYTQMQSKCELLGGYLVELDSHDEFSFIRDYLMKQLSVGTVWTGATDEEHEGVWINKHNLTTRPTFEWGGNEPNSGRLANCQCFYDPLNWFLSDCACSYGSSNYFYICEIPRKIC